MNVVGPAVLFILEPKDVGSNSREVLFLNCNERSTIASDQARSAVIEKRLMDSCRLPLFFLSS